MLKTMFALVLATAAVTACSAADSEEPAEPEFVTVTSEESALLGEQGGCSMAEIRSAQQKCGGAIHGCWKQEGQGWSIILIECVR